MACKYKHYQSEKAAKLSSNNNKEPIPKQRHA